MFLCLFLAFFLNLSWQPRFTHTQHWCHSTSNFPRWPDVGSFRFEQTYQPAPDAFARWVHYLSGRHGRPIRSTAVAAACSFPCFGRSWRVELITSAAQVAVFSIPLSVIFQTAALFFWWVFSGWAAIEFHIGLSSERQVCRHLECVKHYEFLVLQNPRW